MKMEYQVVVKLTAKEEEAFQTVADILSTICRESPDCDICPLKESCERKFDPMITLKSIYENLYITREEEKK